MPFLPGKADRKVSVIEKAGLGIVLLLLGSALLPILTARADAMVTELTESVTFLAPKVAIAAAVIGVIVWISPWHRTHGGKLVSGGAVCAFGAGMIPVLFVWLNTHGVGLAMKVVDVFSSLIQHLGG